MNLKIGLFLEKLAYFGMKEQWGNFNLMAIELSVSDYLLGVVRVEHLWAIKCVRNVYSQI
jgi:hypothetical protein